MVPIDQGRLTAGSGIRCSAVALTARTLACKCCALSWTKQASRFSQIDEHGDPTGVRLDRRRGRLDSRGHELGYRSGARDRRSGTSASHHESQPCSRRAGQSVTVVTDHGWILLPGGLPKSEDVPAAVAEAKKGRCARIKQGAAVAGPTVPWHWDRDTRIAVAPGVSCFEANQIYEHGGVSPQECIVPRLTVTRVGTSPVRATITNVKWRGLTLVAEFAELPDGSVVDLRMSASDPESSIAEMGKITGGRGKVFLLVGDEDLEGQQAHLVVAADRWLVASPTHNHGGAEPMTELDGLDSLAAEAFDGLSRQEGPRPAVPWPVPGPDLRRRVHARPLLRHHRS